MVSFSLEEKNAALDEWEKTYLSHVTRALDLYDIRVACVAAHAVLSGLQLAGMVSPNELLERHTQVLNARRKREAELPSER